MRYIGKFSENKDAVAMHKKRLNTIREKMQTTPNDEITDSIMELFTGVEYSAHVACALNQSCMNKDQKIDCLRSMIHRIEKNMKQELKVLEN